MSVLKAAEATWTGAETSAGTARMRAGELLRLFFRLLQVVLVRLELLLVQDLLQGFLVGLLVGRPLLLLLLAQSLATGETGTLVLLELGTLVLLELGTLTAFRAGERRHRNPTGILPVQFQHISLLLRRKCITFGHGLRLHLRHHFRIGFTGALSSPAALLGTNGQPRQGHRQNDHYFFHTSVNY